MNLYESISWKSIAQPKWEKEGEIIIHISFGQHPTFLQIELDPRPPSDILYIFDPDYIIIIYCIHIKDLIDTKLFLDIGEHNSSPLYIYSKSIKRSYN